MIYFFTTFYLLTKKVKTKKKKPKTVAVLGFFSLVGEDGFEPSKRYAADLQSVPFGHSGTPPYKVVCLSQV